MGTTKINRLEARRQWHYRLNNEDTEHSRELNKTAELASESDRAKEFTRNIRRRCNL